MESGRAPVAISWAGWSIRVLATVVVIAALVLAVVSRHWAQALLVVFLILYGVVLRRRTKPVQLVFELGQHERHQVTFWFDKFWGDLSVAVDGKTVVRDQRLFSVTLTKTYSLQVGDREVHEVRMEKDRTLLLAGARAQPIRAYVDDVLIAEATA